MKISPMNIYRRLLLTCILCVPMLSGCNEGGADSTTTEAATFDTATFDNASWD